MATNGHVLHVAYRATAPRTEGAIIPRGLFDICKAPAAVYVSATHARVAAANGATYTAKLLDAKFPDYARVTPAAKDRPHLVEVTQARIDAVNAAVSFNKANREKFGYVGIKADGTLQNRDGSLTLPWCDGLPADIGFNAAYLLDAMKAAGIGATMQFSTGPADKFGALMDSLLITAPDFAAVVMPMCK